MCIRDRSNAEPELNTGLSVLNEAINPVFTGAFTPGPTASVNPLQVLLSLASVVWLAGAAVMLLWALTSYLRLRRRVAQAVRLEGNAFECERVDSPFVLGLFRPRIYPVSYTHLDVYKRQSLSSSFFTSRYTRTSFSRLLTLLRWRD